MSLDDIEAEVHSLADRRLSRHSESLNTLKSLVLPAGTALVAVSQLMGGGEWTGWTIAGTTAAATVFLVALFIARTDGDAPKEIVLARRAAHQAREQESRAREAELIHRYREDSDNDETGKRARELYLAVNAMRGTLDNIGPTTPLERWLPALMTAAEPHMKVALGFSIEQTWTIDVFRLVDEGGAPQLKLAATKRSYECDINRARTWPIGIGYPGVAYANNREIVVDNTGEATISQMFPIGDRARSHDSDHYASFAAVPVSVGPGRAPWGVVIATSNQLFHFNLEEGGGVHATECARALAGMIGLGVALSGRQHADALATTVESQGGSDVPNTDA